MSYRSETVASLKKRERALFAQRAAVPSKFKDRRPKEQAWITRKIEEDIAYVQYHIDQMGAR
jgi:hypothetical protein